MADDDDTFPPEIQKSVSIYKCISYIAHTMETFIFICLFTGMYFASNPAVRICIQGIVSHYCYIKQTTTTGISNHSL